MDCKIKKNGNVLKLKNANTIPKVKNGYTINVEYSITFPRGVKKIGVSTDVSPDDYVILSVTPGKPYRFMSRYLHLEPTDDDPDTEYYGYVIDELNYGSGGALLGNCHGTYYITYSEEINNAEAVGSW